MRMNYFKLKFLLLFFALAVTIPPAWAEPVTDVIDYNVTKDLIGNTGATAWAELEIEGQSGAKYVLYTMGNLNENQGICWNKNGYLYTKESPGKLKSVTFIGNTGTGNKRAVNIFAQNNAYTEKASGTYIKQVQFDNEGITYSFSDEYKYIAINGTASSTLINSISIEWETEGSGETPVKQDLTTFEFSSATASATMGEAFTAPTLTVNPTVDVTYSSSDPGVATVANDGTVTLVGAGTTTITASFAGNDEYNAATASYTLTVNAAQPTGLITDFSESFNNCDGKGGNDGSWSGNIASNKFDDSKADNDGWTLVSGNAANACIKLGTGSALGSAQTPEISVTPGITYTLTFKAGAWSGDKTTLNLSATGGDLGAPSVTMTSADWQAYSITFTATDETARIKFEGFQPSKARFFLDEVRLTHDQNATPVTVVAKPEFSVAGGSYTEAQTVTITCATDGATIYYTTDGTEPTASSTEYTGAISINETTTLKAIAVKDGQSSAVAEATYTFPTVVTNLAEANKLATGTNFVYNGYAVVTYAYDSQQYNNADVWIRDDQGNAAYLFRAVPLGFKNGDVLETGWTATKDVYNGLNELKNVTMKKDGTAEAKPIKPITVPKVTNDDVNQFVRLEKISSISEADWSDKFSTDLTLDPNKQYNVEGIVGYNNGLQFYPISVEEVDEPVVTPVITVGSTQLTINDETGDAKTGTLTATVDPAAEITAETSTTMWAANVAESKVTYNGRALHETGTVTYKSEGATDVTANLEYNYTGPLYILGYVNGGDWSASNAVQMEGPSTEGLYTATFTTTPNADNQSEISFTKRKGSDWNQWSEIYDYRFVPVSNGTWVLADETTNVYCDLDFDPAHVDNQKIVMPAGKYTVTIDAKNNKFKIEPVIETVATPTFEPAPQEEAFTTVQNVTITCATVDAAIHYTTDGTEPTAESAVYSEPIVVNDGTTTIKAIAMKEGMTNSEVASATYTVNLPTLEAPTFDHESNIYDDAFEVTITAAEGATIHYTTDGNEPTAESAVYKARIPVNKNMTIKAIAVKEGYKTSAVATAEYQIKVAKPTFSPVPGTFDAATQVSIVCGTEGATIHYTTDGNEPTAESPVYSQPIAVNSGTMTIKAIAIKKDMTNSDIAEGVYTIKQNAGLAFDPTTATAEAGAEEFTAPTLVNPNNLSPITYKSSDENVAAFVDGVLVIGDAGETTITATFAGNEEFNEGSASYTLTVTKKDAGLKYEQAELTVYAGNDFTAPTLVNPNKLSPITYSSDNENVAMVDDKTGEVVLMDEIGDAKITATFAGNGQYNEATASYTIHVIAKKTATLTFDPTQVTVYVGTEEITQPTLTTNPNNLSPITYSSDNENVAMVDDKTGEVVLMDEIGNAKITATFAGNDEYAKAEASYTITVEAKPAIIVDFESLTMAAKVGETATATFNVLGTDLKEVVTLTLNDANGVYTINPESNISIKDAEEGATVTVTYKPTAAGSHEATISVTTKDAETATVTLNGTATVPEVVAMPTFSLVAGSYTGPQQVIINCATEGATISYSTDGGNTWTVGNTVNVDKDMTIMAKASKDGYTISETATGYYVIDIPEALPTDMPTFDGYYSVLNSGKYANIQGRKTLTFTDAPNAQAGTVIRLKSDNTGKVEVLRSQAADLQRYAYRAMDYVPDIVQIVVDKLGAEGEGHILGKDGLDAIMTKFDESFKPDLYIEKAGDNGYRIYGRTPSMQPVVDFYRENKDKVEAKLPDLVAFINSALAKLRNKANQAGMDGDNVFVDFDLKTIWTRMGGNLTDPEVDEMGFYRDVLNYKDNVWNFAYQTATFYLEKIKNTGTYTSLSEQLGEFAQYLDKIDQIHPDFKYYIVANEEVTKPDFISQGNADIINNAARTIWTLEPRTDFTVNFPEANKHNGEYVTTLYTDFAYTLPEGVTAWAVTSVSDQGIGELTAIDGTTIAAQTPVLLKSTTAGDVATFGITTADGTAAPEGNLLVGPDYLIETYQIKTPEVVKMFEAIKTVLGENIYNDLVDKYGHLQFRTSGTVNNKYFWGLNEEEVKSCAEENPETGKKVKVVRSLGIKDDLLGFNDNEHVYTNKALLVSTEHSAINFSLRGDINKDGVISIIDVTALIDILLDLPARNYLEPTTSYPKGLDYEAANVNENEEGIEITDVTTLIDILLNMPDQPAQGSGN